MKKIFEISLAIITSIGGFLDVGAIATAAEAMRGCCILAFASACRRQGIVIENSVSLLGLITLAFVVATFKLHPSLTEIGSGLLPTLPRQDTPHYLFIAVSILGALISPYLFYFYSSGAIEDKWDEGCCVI